MSVSVQICSVNRFRGDVMYANTSTVFFVMEDAMRKNSHNKQRPLIIAHIERRVSIHINF